jgi:hypothetical protein
MSQTVTNERVVSVSSNEVNSRWGDDGEPVTVAELLRREGVTQELPVVTDPVDDAPTDRIPVAELLRREGRWNRRKASKIGAVAAGLAALAGVAVSVLSTGQLHDTGAAAAGGIGGPYVPPEAKTSQLSSPLSLASSETTTPVSTSGGQVSTEHVSTGGATSDTTNRAQSTTGRSSGSAAQTSAAPTSDAAAGSSSSGTTTTTTRSDPSTTSTTTTTPQPVTRTSAPTSTEQPNNGGLLGVVTGLLGGILGG